MENKPKKTYIAYMVVAVLCLVVIVTSATYAYFKAQIKGEGSGINLTGSTFTLSIDESVINTSGLAPIYDSTKDTKAQKNTFTVTMGTLGISSACYNLYLEIDSIGTNLQNKYFKYELSDGTNTYTGNFDGRTNGSKILLSRNETLNTTNSSKTYTLKLWLSYSETEDQTFILTGEETTRTFQGHLRATGVTGSCPELTLAEAILQDNAVSTRTDFSVTNTANTTGTIYSTDATEDGSTVYYYSGNTTNNWVQFGGFYWRIIRTNEDGSVRLLYSGTSPDTTEGYIGTSKYNTSSNNPMYVGYMYGSSGSLANNRTNTNDSTIKQTIDTWYENNLLTDYDKYISKTAIYCNDRSIGSGTYNTGYTSFDYGAYTRLNTNKTPTYKCGGNTIGGLFATADVADKFSASTSGGGNGQLKYPIALMTADEVAYAGGVADTTLESPYAWYYTNAKGESIVVSWYWWTMAPYRWSGFDRYSYVWGVDGRLIDLYVINSYAVRPSISLKSCVLAEGDGTSTSPYQISIDDACISAEN